MALCIEQKESIFEFTGSFHASQTQQVRTYFKHKLNGDGKFEICLQKLEDIDLAGVIMLRCIKDSALELGCQISVRLGNNQRILGPFRQLNEPMLVA
ncbi:hypothetical protein [Aureitalea marina]|uniref:STAS domain-containing protein n=1 Tax=Aureitalea marina TaxID=930804 RepID=A0A2S7KLH8_9FLAO|nr:hypothetical protein [Aureitalea marina]PQB03489.1 hypothetical protein BST85_00205 [Aureitalea marina]